MRTFHQSFKAALILLGLSLATPASAQQAAIPSFADLVEKLSPSVVNISSTQKPEAFEGGEVLQTVKDLNSDQTIATLPQEHYALGSGFILDKDGYILTNNHVIEQASAVNVILSDNTEYKAKVIGSDPKTDIALIKITPDKPLQPVTLGDSDKIRVGDWILAIGNPFGLGGSVTAGIVSAKSRDIASGPYDSFIQTDASINQGSSGGPMFNLNGEVIGINTAIFSTTGGSMGIGFAIPVNLTNFVVRQLKETGSVKRGWIGVKIQPVLSSADIKAKIPEGVLVSGVTENSSAQKAAIEAGDIIVTLNKQPISSAQEFSRTIAESPIGQEISLLIWRNGVQKEIKLKIEEMPTTSAEAPKAETTPAAETQTGTEADKVNDKDTAAPAEILEEMLPAEPAETTEKTTETPALPEAAAKSAEEVKADKKITEALDLDLDLDNGLQEDKETYEVEAAGLTIRTLSLKDLDELNLKPDTMGVIITEVRPGSDAYIKDLKVGSIITQVNKKNIFNAENFKTAIDDAKLDGGEPAVLTVKSENDINNVQIKVKDAL